MSAVIGRPSAADIERVIGLLEEKLEADQPMTRGQLRSCVPEPEVVINVALDQMQTSERAVRRTIAGRIVFYLPNWTPPKPPHRKPEALASPAALSATLDWHAESAEREAQRRNAGSAADFPLPDAMSNTGEFEPETFAEPGSMSLHIDDAKFALWSDGRLEIDAGDTHLTLTKAATHRLFHFLDQFSSIEAH